MLQKFMDGKKKYSAFIITALVAAVPMLIQEPEAQKTFMDLVPSLAAVLAGIFYIVTQGSIDKTKEQVKIVEAEAVIALNGSATKPRRRTEHRLSQQRHRDKSSL